MSAMQRKITYKNLLTKALFALFFCFYFAQHVQAVELSNTTKTLLLGETVVKINIYENNPVEITFFAPHYNERPGAEAAKKIIAEKGGRLIEIESLDASKNSLRNLKFQSRNESYSIDPNRIFTVNGRKCSNFTPQIDELIIKFADDLLKIIRPDEHHINIPIVAVHNNQDVDEKELGVRNRDLTANAFTKSGAYDAQSRGVYLSNSETDEDNFVFLSSPVFLSFFAEKDFNVVVQKSAKQLFSENCAVDDGSLSVYFGQRTIPYINLEADIKNGSFRQRQMLETVYSLVEEVNQKSIQEKKQ